MMSNPAGHPITPDSRDIENISETVNLIADTARTLLESTHREAVPTNDAPTTTEQPQLQGPVSADLLLRLLKSASDTSWAVAETGRLRAVAAAATHASQPSPATQQACTVDPTMGAGQGIRSHTTAVQNQLIRPGIGRVIGDSALVISERVGTVSLELWEGMSQDKLKQLDGVLSRIVQRICDKGIGWGPTGSIIQEELAAFGLRFATPSYFPETDRSLDWKRAADTNSSDLARIQGLSDHCRPFLGHDWYTDEMIRVVQRLMELRGFQQ